MPAAIVARNDNTFTVQVEIPYATSMLDFEELIQQRLNEARVLATTEALQQFDADGSPIQVGDTKLTSKGKLVKEYQTPYGVAPVERHVYQSSRGGKTYCPLDRDARIVYRFTLSLLKQHPDRRQSLAMKRRGCGWSDAFLMEVIGALTC